MKIGRGRIFDFRLYSCGCAGFDVSANPEIVHSANRINAALEKAEELKIKIPFIPLVLLVLACLVIITSGRLLSQMIACLNLLFHLPY